MTDIDPNDPIIKLAAALAEALMQEPGYRGTATITLDNVCRRRLFHKPVNLGSFEITVNSR